MSLNVKKAKEILETELLDVEKGLKEFKNLEENGFVDKLKCQN